ncbi:FYVE, RhoGEF and PH domain-containing protein 6-like [Bradysia coprophila]|uniref:FYVE, RhoGEF and PH domain-containing protein 6-like n=1 Tax=Bradysia coprophila TaxID=38358 RepID=UPI00187D6FD7|nr:FYVE, RhoGEF and PH domain-containing protein 6-like [Bradysia coprophila]
MHKTPQRTNRQSSQYSASPFTPPKYTSSLSQELKQVLFERNLLTAKSRKKVCSMLDSMSPKVSPGKSNDVNKRKNFRLQAVQEILTSERSYINQLQILMKYFVNPLKEQDVLSNDEFTILFGQIEMIYNLNTELLKSLESDLSKVGKAFLRLAPFFKLYSVYAFDYNRSQIVLQELTEKNQRFRKFLEQTESRPEVQTKLMSLLISPIQRVPRYRLLLQQVILYSSPVDDDDFKILQDSFKEVENTVSHMNSVVQEQEVTQMVINLQNSLVDQVPKIIKPSRKIIKEGVLQKMSSSGVTLKRYCVLMSDIFMYCKILKDRNKNTMVSNSLQCSCIFPLKKCRISEVFPGTFKITCQGDGIILCADDVGISKCWMTAIKETIELHIQCRKTIRKGSSKRTPMRNKALKNFEVDEVLSPTKKKYDYDSVYRCSDFSDSESDIEEHNRCFNFDTPSLFGKRKHSDVDDKDKRKVSEPDVVPRKMFRNWFRKGPAEVESQNGDDFDPTYGFAKQLENRTYIRNSNAVDTSIPIASMDYMGVDYQDVLYPLRTSTGSNDSSASAYYNTSNGHRSNEHTKSPAVSTTTSNLNANVFLPVTPTRKRVKFDERSNKVNFFRRHPHQYHHKPQHTKGYLFNAQLDDNEKLTFRQRITNFFANLF